MSQMQSEGSDSDSIEAILKHLSSRPNVESTLILSRKDGSIIRSSGFRDSQQRPTSSQNDSSDQAVEGRSVSEKEENEDKTDSDLTQGQPKIMTAAERFAGSIYAFVKAADGFAMTLSPDGSFVDSFAIRRMSENSKHQQDGNKIPVTDEENETGVQLLRMRTKRQEVIIFPDANYLCCVIQNTSRGAKS